MYWPISVDPDPKLSFPGTPGGPGGPGGPGVPGLDEPPGITTRIVRLDSKPVTVAKNIT